MPEPFANAVPSNYVPLPRVSERPGRREQDVEHDRSRAADLTGVLELRVRALDPIRVGQGSFFPARYPQLGPRLIQDQALAAGRPFIPGSSIKGTVRSLAEALLGGCDEPGSCSPTCYACSLFGYVVGSKTFMGRVGFEDAVPLQAKMVVLNVATAFRPRRPVGRRAYGPRPAELEGKEPAMAIAAGSTLKTRMTFRNLSVTEMGGVLAALGQDGSFAPRLGGAKHFGFGRARFEPLSLNLRRDYRMGAQHVGGSDIVGIVRQFVDRAGLPEGADAVLMVLRQQMPDARREDQADA